MDHFTYTHYTVECSNNLGIKSASNLLKNSIEDRDSVLCVKR